MVYTRNLSKSLSFIHLLKLFSIYSIVMIIMNIHLKNRAFLWQEKKKCWWTWSHIGLTSSLQQSVFMVPGKLPFLLPNYQQEQDINNSFTATLDAPSPLLCFKSNKNCNLSITYTNIQFTPTVYLCGSLTLWQTNLFCSLFHFVMDMPLGIHWPQQCDLG